MASVSSLDSDLRNLRLSKYTPQLSAICVSYLSRTLSEPFDGDLLELLRSGVILCRLYNLLSPPVSIKYKASSMPFVQMENISHFLRAISEAPVSLPPHDRFLTVDLYERKDPAQVVQCLTSFSRRANELNPSAFPDTIGGLKGSGQRIVSAEKPRIPDKKKDAVSAWTKREQEGVTAPAWNVVQYGYMGGASQGSEGISFGGRRQITQTPMISDFEARRAKEKEEKEKLRVQKEQEDKERRRQREEEEKEFLERERLRSQRQESENQRLQQERESARRQRLEQEAIQRRREQEEAATTHRRKLDRQRAQEEESQRLQAERETARRQRIQQETRLQDERETARRHRIQQEETRLQIEREEEEHRQHEAERIQLLEAHEREAEEARKDALHIAAQEERRNQVAASHDRFARATPLQLGRELEHNDDPLTRERRRVQELEAQLAQAREMEKKYAELMAQQSSPPPPAAEEQRALPTAPNKNHHARIADSRPLPTPPLRKLALSDTTDRKASWTKGDDQKPISRPPSPEKHRQPSRPPSPVKGPRPPSPVKARPQAPVFRPMSLLERERERERTRQKEWEREHQHQY